MMRPLTVSLVVLVLAAGLVYSRGHNPPADAKSDWAYSYQPLGPVWIVVDTEEVFAQPAVTLVWEERDKELVDSLMGGVLPQWMKKPPVMTYKEYIDYAENWRKGTSLKPGVPDPTKKLADIVINAFTGGKENRRFAVICRHKNY